MSSLSLGLDDARVAATVTRYFIAEGGGSLMAGDLFGLSQREWRELDERLRVWLNSSNLEGDTGGLN